MNKRTMLVEVKPLEPGNILGLREQFATAEVLGAEITWSHGFGVGVTMISMEVRLPDGTRIAETMGLQDLLVKWAEEVLTDQGVTA